MKISVLGLGYVGRPLAEALSAHFPVVGVDPDPRVLAAGAPFPLAAVPPPSDVYIVAVPTPVDENRAPDLRHVRAATESVGGVLAAGQLVVYESTVHPGCTDEQVPVLEGLSGLRHNADFFTGYSPERINPGDTVNTLRTIVKPVCGSTARATETMERVYGTICRTHRTPTIATAEFSKVLENTQRDVNVALMNEASRICDRLGIDMAAVLDCARTRWNWNPFKPGFVGGHCVAVDPYYLAAKATQIGVDPRLILAARRINDAHPEFIAGKVARLLSLSGRNPGDAVVAVYGLAFKPDVPDIRTSLTPALVRELESFGALVGVVDPLADPAEARDMYGIRLVPEVDRPDAAVIAVRHSCFGSITAPIVVDVQAT